MKMDKNKQNKAKLAGMLLSLTAVSVALILAVSVGLNRSFGWFVLGTTVNAKNMGVKSLYEGFELYASGDETTPLGANDAMVQFLEDESNGGYEYRRNTNLSHDKMMCNLIIDPDSGTVEPGRICPGAFGRISFDIVVSDTEDRTFDINLGFITASQSAQGLESTTSDAVLQSILRGHILLFNERTGNNGVYSYSDQIKDMTLTFNTTAHTSETEPRQINGEYHYKVTVYWVWPITYAHFAYDDSDPRQIAKSIYSSSTERAEVLQSILEQDANDVFINVGKYFKDLNFTDSSADDYINLSRTDVFDYYYVELSDGYNNADQYIGEYARHLVLTVDVFLQEQ